MSSKQRRIIAMVLVLSIIFIAGVFVFYQEEKELSIFGFGDQSVFPNNWVEIVVKPNLQYEVEYPRMVVSTSTIDVFIRVITKGFYVKYATITHIYNGIETTLRSGLILKNDLGTYRWTSDTYDLDNVAGLHTITVTVAIQLYSDSPEVEWTPVYSEAFRSDGNKPAPEPTTTITTTEETDTDLITETETTDLPIISFMIIPLIYLVRKRKKEENL